MNLSASLSENPNIESAVTKMKSTKATGLLLKILLTVNSNP